MAVPKKKTSKTKKRTRRSHHALKKARLVKCKKCGASMIPHRACSDCGDYKGRSVIDVRSKQEKKKEKQKKAEERKKAKSETKNKK